MQEVTLTHKVEIKYCDGISKMKSDKKEKLDDIITRILNNDYSLDEGEDLVISVQRTKISKSIYGLSVYDDGRTHVFLIDLNNDKGEELYY